MSNVKRGEHGEPWNAHDVYMREGEDDGTWTVEDAAEWCLLSSCGGLDEGRDKKVSARAVDCVNELDGVTFEPGAVRGLIAAVLEHLLLHDEGGDSGMNYEDWNRRAGESWNAITETAARIHLDPEPADA